MTLRSSTTKSDIVIKMRINQHRIIRGQAPAGSHISCLDSGSCATRSDATGRFELILWNDSCQCQSLVVQKQSFGPSTTWPLPPTTGHGTTIDLRLCQHRTSVFGPAQTFEDCDAGKIVDVHEILVRQLSPCWLAILVAGGFFFASVAYALMARRSVRVAEPFPQDVESESESYESESEDEAINQPSILIAPARCTHMANEDDGYNLRSQCKKCAAHAAGVTRLPVMESPEAPTPAAIEQLFGTGAA